MDAKRWYLSRTVWAGILEIVIGALGLLATWLQQGDFSLPAVILLVVGVLTIILRKLTTQPIE